MLKIGTDHGVDAQVLTWLNDLRTGRAGEQGGMRLHTSSFLLGEPQQTSHCCLGLVDARIKHTEETANVTCNSVRTYLDPNDRYNIGISYEESRTLAELNDREPGPVSFSEIADVIEQAWRCGKIITMDFAYMVTGLPL